MRLQLESYHFSFTYFYPDVHRDLTFPRSKFWCLSFKPIPLTLDLNPDLLQIKLIVPALTDLDLAPLILTALIFVSNNVQRS